MGNVPEQVVATVLMLAGAIGWGLVLGTIVGNLSNLDPERDQFTSIMSELNKMMSREDLPRESASSEPPLPSKRSSPPSPPTPVRAPSLPSPRSARRRPHRPRLSGAAASAK